MSPCNFTYNFIKILQKYKTGYNIAYTLEQEFVINLTFPNSCPIFKVYRKDK